MFMSVELITHQLQPITTTHYYPYYYHFENILPSMFTKFFVSFIVALSLFMKWNDSPPLLAIPLRSRMMESA